jgi:hypothetical protein
MNFSHFAISELAEVKIKIPFNLKEMFNGIPDYSKNQLKQYKTKNQNDEKNRNNLNG